MRKPAIVLSLTLLLIIGVGARTSAQSGNPFQAIQNTLDALVDAVESIRGAVEPGDTLATSPIRAGNRFLSCFVVNVSASTRSVRIEAHNLGGDIVTDPATISLGAGQGFGLGVFVSPSFGYCKFTVTNGTKNDVRGNVQIMDEATQTTILVAEAS